MSVVIKPRPVVVRVTPRRVEVTVRVGPRGRGLPAGWELTINESNTALVLSINGSVVGELPLHEPSE